MMNEQITWSDDVLDEVRRILADTAASSAPQPSPCCSTEKQATCCEASEKSSCCGAGASGAAAGTPAGGCGCQ